MWLDARLLLLLRCAPVSALVTILAGFQRNTVQAQLTSASLQVLVQPGASALITLLRKTFYAAMNASTGTPGVIFPLVSPSWDLLCRIIHEGGARATSMTVR